MIVKVRLFANLRSLLPEGSSREEVDLDVAEGATAEDIVQQLEIPKGLAHLMMIDGYHLLPDERRSRPLQPGEVLSIFPPIAGG